MKWEAIKHNIIGTAHVADVGEGDLALRAWVSNNGAGWFNWWVSPKAADDYMAEHFDRIQGGAKTLREAKAAAEFEIEKYIRGLAASLGIQVGP